MNDSPDSEQVTNSDSLTMRLRDPLLFLFGVESSIRRVLRCRLSLLLAFALVATAAMAREYDAVSWMHAPQDLLGPFAASLVICTVLFFTVQICLAVTGVKRDPQSDRIRDYRVFLVGYWMTAPLAWLYAIPIETMAGEVVSLRFNLTLLSIVSIWRVLLFSRVVAIQFGLRWWVPLFWILVPCMVIAFFALLSAQLSMVSLMGGIRLTQTQQILVNYQSTVAGGCFYGIIPVLLVALVAIGTSSNPKHRFKEVGRGNVSMPKSVWLWPTVSGALLLFAATLFQPNLIRSTEVDSLLREGAIEEAIATMQAAGEDSYPVVWDPPPKHPDRGDGLPEISLIADAIQATNAERWIVDRLMVQADEIAMRQEGWYQGTGSLEYLRERLQFEDEETLDGMLVPFQKLRELEVGDQKTRQHREELIEIIEEAREAVIQAKESKASEGSTEDEDVAENQITETTGPVVSEEQSSE